jgi:hypothetical protein
MTFLIVRDKRNLAEYNFMSQSNTIILRFPEGKAAEFERLFKAEVLPLWRKFKSEGKFLAASLTPIQGGMTPRKGLRHYVLHVEVPGMAEHEEFDSHPVFTKFLAKAQAMQAEDSLVWFGETLFQV